MASTVRYPRGQLTCHQTGPRTAPDARVRIGARVQTSELPKHEGDLLGALDVGPS